MSTDAHPSPLRALLWKEWRQQRWVYLTLLGLACALALAAHFAAAKNGTPLESTVFAALLIPSALAGAGGLLILCANAFCGEQEESSNQFLDAIPCGRGRIFRIKIGFVLFLGLLGLAPLSVWLFCYHLAGYIRIPGNWPSSALITVVLLTLAIMPSVIASFGLSAIAAILLSIPASVGYVGLIYISDHAFAASGFGLSGLGGRTAGVSRLLNISVALVALFLAAQRLWALPERKPRRYLWTAAAMAGMLSGYAVLSIAAGWYDVTYRAPLSFFLAVGPPSVYGHLAGVSPNGRYAIIETYYRGWGDSSRAALVNIESGQYQWLTRSRCSYFIQRDIAWSPSGDKFLLTENDRWLIPRLPLNQRGAWRYTHWHAVAVDARTGAQFDILKACPGLPDLNSPNAITFSGWYNENLFAIGMERDIYFADIEHHTVQKCRGTPDSKTLLRGVRSARGILATQYGPGSDERTVLRYAPELPDAETLVLHGVHGAITTMDVSEDGRWLLLGTSSSTKSLYQFADRWFIARLQNGAEAGLLDTRGPDSFSTRFIAGSHEVLQLYLKESTVRIFDAETHRIRRIAIEFKGEHASDSIMNDVRYPVKLLPGA